MLHAPPSSAARACCSASGPPPLSPSSEDMRVKACEQKPHNVKGRELVGGQPLSGLSRTSIDRYFENQRPIPGRPIRLEPTPPAPLANGVPVPERWEIPSPIVHNSSRCVASPPPTPIYAVRGKARRGCTATGQRRYAPSAAAPSASSRLRAERWQPGPQARRASPAVTSASRARRRGASSTSCGFSRRQSQLFFLIGAFLKTYPAPELQQILERKSQKRRRRWQRHSRTALRGVI